MPDHSRRLYDVTLEPESGSRFQPTGFPDIGAATFRRPVVGKNGEVTTVECLLVESAQSMANHLEGTAWDAGANEPVDVVAGLPYVRVQRADGSYVTSSRVEAHRLASAFVKDSKVDGRHMTEVIREKLALAEDTPLDHRGIAAAVARLDPLCLLHGVFFAESAKVWPGQPKIARAVTGFVEAEHVEPVVSGGVKRDLVAHEAGDAGGSAEGYGSIPFHRMEYTAARITASFSVDLAQLRSYGLGDAATTALDLLAQWEIRSVLDGSLRLRTACAFEAVSDIADRRSGDPLPSGDDLESALTDAIGRSSDVFGDGEPLVVVWEEKRKKKDREP